MILRTYRRINGITQEQLGVRLGFDKTYVSMIETGRRSINDVATLRHIARTLGFPPRILGVTDSDDADFAAMLQFADSTIRLAEIARKSGRAVDAVNEIWPLVARLEARAFEGRIERDTLLLLAQARLVLGVSLGDVLPEERLATAASWTGKAVLVAERLDATAFLAHALRRHGNELRKADRTAAASTRLQRATHLSSDVEGQGTAYALLARTAGERGDAALFDESIRACHDLLNNNGEHGMIFNPFSPAGDPAPRADVHRPAP
ncbi:MAG: helix-turn-helix domain-containing protein [Pseudonocardiaceae bacterium]